MTRKIWSDGDDALMRKHYPDMSSADLARLLGCSVSAVYNRANILGLKKSQAFMNGPKSGRSGLAERGASTRFKKGFKPWNAGMKGLDIGGKATRFKPGQRPQTWVPIGTEVETKDGYLKRKIRDDAEPGMSRHNWKLVHILVWEEANGPVPKGHCLRFKDGNKRNCSLDNLELITRAENQMRNTIHRYPPEVKQAIRLVGKLKRKIREKQDEKHDG